MDKRYTDILIAEKDVILDINDIPTGVSDRDAITQDFKHMIMERNYFVRLIGERNPQKHQQAINEITLEMDADTRIVAGTSKVIKNDSTYYVIAKTVDYGTIEFEL